MKKNVSRILIPNRGEIACRLIAACHATNAIPILAYSLADAGSKAKALVSTSVCIGGGDARESYLSIPRIISAARDSGADAIHPGYGFLAENSDFASAAQRARITFIGPTATAMKKLGDKVQAKKIAARCGVPTLEGITLNPADIKSATGKKRLQAFLKSASFPVLVKAAAGGGGRGMRIIQKPQEAAEQVQSASREALSLFADGTVFIEPYVVGARHIEVQIIGDESGDIRALGTRDCSLQRRHQKVIEEAPASSLSPSTEQALCNAAEKICTAAAYHSLATVEFLVDADANFYFLEVNTRLQVEHPATEESLGIRLVELQIEVARGGLLKSLLKKQNPPRYSIEARICAEQPENDFRAATGSLVHIEFPEGENLRIESGYRSGDRVPLHYDSLLAKIIASGDSRQEALSTLSKALGKTSIAPLRSNLGYLNALVSDPRFRENTHTLTQADQVLKEYLPRYTDETAYALSIAAALRSYPKTGSDALWFTDGASQAVVGLKLFNRYFQAKLKRRADDLSITLESDDGYAKQISITRHQKDESRFSCLIDGVTVDAQVTTPYRDGTVVQLKGERYPVEYAEKPARRRTQSVEKHGSADILADLPGKIVAIKVRKNNLVSQGQTVIVLESMKMEHSMTAPVSGTVTDLRCRIGQIVQGGEMLLKIVPRRPVKKK